MDPSHPILSAERPLAGRSAADALFPLSEDPGHFPAQFLIDNPLAFQEVPRISRDGTLLLSRYFSAVPVARRPDEILVVHRRSSSVVPAGWSGAVATYELTFSPPSRERSRLLVCGVLYPSIHPLERILSSFDEIRAAWQGREVECMWIFGEEPWSAQGAGSYGNRVLSAFFERFGQRARPIGWKEFRNLGSLEDYAFFELDPFPICADSFLTHHLLSRGAVPLIPETQGVRPSSSGPGTLRVPLSEHHFLEIRTPQSWSAQVLERFQEVRARL